MRSLLSGSVVALYSRCRARSSSREISGRLPNQVLDELEADPVGSQRGAKVIDEAADHLIGDSVECLVVDDGRRAPDGDDLGLHGLDLDLEAPVGRPEGKLQGRVIPPGLAAGGDRAVAGLRHGDVQLIDVLEAEADDAAQRRRGALGGRDHLRLRGQLELGEEPPGRVMHVFFDTRSGLGLAVARQVGDVGGAGLQLLAPAPGGGHALADGLADGVLGVVDGAPRPLGVGARLVRQVALVGQLDGPAAEAVDLVAAGPRGQVGPRQEADQPADQEAPAEPAAALALVRTLRHLLHSPSTNDRQRLAAPTLTPCAAAAAVFAGPRRPIRSLPPISTAPDPTARSPRFTPAVSSFTLPMLSRTSGSVSRISSVVVTTSSSTALSVRVTRYRTQARNSASTRARIPRARKAKPCVN